MACPTGSAFRVPRSSPPTDLIQLLQPHEHVPRLAPVRRPQDAGELQLIDDPGGPAVPDAHAALQQRRGAQLVLDADFGGLAEQHVAPLPAPPLPPPPPPRPPPPLPARRPPPDELPFGPVRPPPPGGPPRPSTTRHTHRLRA